MTAITLGQAACPGRLGQTAIAAAIKVGRLTRSRGGCFVGPAHIPEQFEIDGVTSRPQEFAGGFVDFLLGRVARHPR
jgi:hypothetical protein